MLIEKGQHIDKDIVRFVENCLFTTLTNVNFDADVHVSLLRESQQIKEKLREVVGEIKNHTLIWHEGIYKFGNWKYGIFKKGGFYGTWENGIWEDGTFKGKWESGVR